MFRRLATLLALLTAAPAAAQQLVIQEPGDYELRPTQCASVDITLVHSNGHLIPERQHQYASTDMAVASVDPRGLICGVAPGRTRVILTARSRRVEIGVTVLPPDVPLPPDTVPPDTVPPLPPPDTLDPDPGALGSIETTWGDGQEGRPGAQLPLVLEVFVRDVAGQGVPGVAVDWQPASGTTEHAQTLTGSAGGTRTHWTLGDAVGEQTLTARAIGYGQVTFTALATDTTSPPPPDTVTVPPPDTTPPPPPPPPPPPGGSIWSHMRTSAIDYRIHYQREPEKSAEYDWAAARYDHVTGGLRVVAPWRARNPAVVVAIYDKFWFTPSLDAGGTESWLRAQGCSVEDAYLHAAGAARDSANRITAQQFAGRWYWYYNLSDPCWRRWREQRTRTLVAQGASTIFWDSNSPSTVRKYVPATTAEYPSHAAYFSDYHEILAAQRQLVPAGYMVANHAQHFTKAEEMATAAVVGGVMTEYENTPFGSGVKEWNAIDQLVANGVVVQFGTGVSPGSLDDARYSITPGNFASIKERVLMWEYASYLMVVDPNRMDAVLFEPYGLNWSTPFPEVWLAAFERDIGLAVGKRSVLATGTDGAGQSYQAWAREFAGALVVIRPQGGRTAAGVFDYGDASAATVPLPAGTWRPLRADGSLGAAVSSIQLRAGEAVVLVRG